MSKAEQPETDDSEPLLESDVTDDPKECATENARKKAMADERAKALADERAAEVNQSAALNAEDELRAALESEIVRDTIFGKELVAAILQGKLLTASQKQVPTITVHWSTPSASLELIPGFSACCS